MSGDAAGGTSDTGSPVKIGGLASATAPTAVSTGQRTNAWFGLNGETKTANVGSGTIATGQVSVGTTATLIAAARTGRSRVTVTVTTAVACSYGNAGVTLTTGYPLTAVAGASDTTDTTAALYGVCASTATVGYKEIY